MLEWIALGVVAAGGLTWLASKRRGQRHRRAWAPILTAAAERHQGHAATSTQTPGLRGTIDGTTVTLSLFDVHRGERDTRVETDVALPDASNVARLYIGWNTLQTPAGLDHVPEVETPPHSLEGTIRLRSDDADAARRYFEKVSLDLVDIQREALAEGLEVTIRGGYLQLTVHGMQTNATAVDRILKVAVKLARHVDTLMPRAAPES